MTRRKRPGTLGWILLTIAWAWTAWLDARSFMPGALNGDSLNSARGGQAIILVLPLLILALARSVPSEPDPSEGSNRGARWIEYGAVLFFASGLLTPASPAAGWITLLGAVTLACGAANLARSSRKHRLALLVVSAGFLGDALLGAAVLLPLPAVHAFFGPFEGLRWRLLRLAQIAALALPVLLLAYEGLGESGAGSVRIRKAGLAAIRFGAVGMPLTLAAAALLDYRLKYALAAPAYAILASAVIGSCLSWKTADGLERSGWLLLCATFAAGLGMGIYAFNGPFPPLPILGDYGDIPRRLVRLSHTYVVVFGLLNIFTGRFLRCCQGRWYGAAAAVLAAAEVITILGLLAVAFCRAPSWLLVPGPVLLALCAPRMAYPPKLAIAVTQPEG